MHMMNGQTAHRHMAFANDTESNQAESASSYRNSIKASFSGELRAPAMQEQHDLLCGRNKGHFHQGLAKPDEIDDQILLSH